MSAYLNDLIQALEAEAERGRARLKKCEAFNASKRPHDPDAGALKRTLQRLEILKAVQKAESDRIQVHGQSGLKPPSLRLPRPPSKKAKPVQHTHHQ
jgi:hypothetical protein